MRREQIMEHLAAQWSLSHYILSPRYILLNWVFSTKAEIKRKPNYKEMLKTGS